MDGSAVIKNIRKDGEAELEKVYVRYRQEFIAWLVKNYQCSVDNATDVYQQTILIFYENILDGKLTEVKSSLKTYLFAIGKNKMMEDKRFRNRFTASTEFQLENQHDTAPDKHREHELELIEHSLKLLGEQCRQLLEMFYYKKNSLEEITGVLGYKNSNTTKNQKYKCMQKLREIHQNELAKVHE